MKASKVRFEASKSSGTVSGLFLKPPDSRSIYVFAHGAGAPMYAKGMQLTAEKLAKFKIATLRYNFPYTEQGRKRPDPPGIAQATVRSAVRKAIEIGEGLPIFAGGKSFGGRMTSQAAADEPLETVRGIVFYGFPLHAPGRDGIERAEHLYSINLPILFLQGTRDALARIPLISEVTDKIPNSKLHILEGGDHSFHLPKSMGITDDEIQTDLAKTVSEWTTKLL